MKISLQHDQIEAAVFQYLASKGLNVPEGGAVIEFTTKRKGGLRILADVDLSASPVKAPVAAAPEVVAEAAPTVEAQVEEPKAEEPAPVVAKEEPAPAEGNSLFG